jgi:hypothetical protein
MSDMLQNPILHCHSRESGNPEPQKTELATLDSRLRGNDEMIPAMVR